MPAIELRPVQRKEKRAEAHHLEPVVRIGGDGLTPAVIKETDAALNAHGLIKVRVFSDERETREAILARLSDELNAAPIQHIGKLLVLWRPIPPKQGGASEPGELRAPRVVKILKFSKSGSQRAQVKRLTVLGNERVSAGGLVKRATKNRVVSLKKRSQGD